MAADNRFRWLIWLSLGEIMMMLVFSNYSALLPVLQKEWDLTNGQAGWIYSSYQIGYILSVVALTSLTDYANTRYIYILSACWSGISGILFSLWSEGFKSALILRTLMGIGLAGTYMPGLRMVSEKFPSRERGKVTGESSVLSTGVTELAHPGGLGRTMALQSLLGFGAASLSPIAFGYILDLANPGDALARLGYIPNWGLGFTLLGVGGLVGPLAIWRMKRRV